MKLRRGLVLADKETGREIKLIKPVGGFGHWNCKCGKKNHRVHEGTLKKFYEELK